jgi:hypothetical protein
LELLRQYGYACSMLVVDPWHWLDSNGSFPVDKPRLYRRILRVAQLIEAGGPLPSMHSRQTLLACPKRPNGKPCSGLTWVVKTVEDAIHAFCPTCRHDEALIHNWQETEWAEGPMQPMPVEAVDPSRLN